MEAVRNALLETRREANAVALPLPSAVQLETSHISIDDRFAAQIVYRAIAPSGAEADFCGGALPAYMPVTELSGFLSFQFSD
jgi:hypothetical protein